MFQYYDLPFVLKTIKEIETLIGFLFRIAANCYRCRIFSIPNAITYMYLYVPYVLSSLNDFEIQRLEHVHDCSIGERGEGGIFPHTLYRRKIQQPNIRNLVNIQH